VDRFDESEIETKYFKERDEAHKYLSENNFEFTLRRVNLEDAFLALTGKKVRQ
jgi:ABC-2 type transport system ATP-binding protein